MCPAPASAPPFVGSHRGPRARGMGQGCAPEPVRPSFSRGPRNRRPSLYLILCLHSASAASSLGIDDACKKFPSPKIARQARFAKACSPHAAPKGREVTRWLGVRIVRNPEGPQIFPMAIVSIGPPPSYLDAHCHRGFGCYSRPDRDPSGERR